MLKNARRAQLWGLIILTSVCVSATVMMRETPTLVREAAAAPGTSSSYIPPPPPGGGGTMSSGYAAPTTGMIGTTVPSTAQVSYQVVTDSPDLTTVNVKYSQNGVLIGFTPVTVPWTQPVAITPPLSIVTVYATVTSVFGERKRQDDPEEGTEENTEEPEVPDDVQVTCRILVNGQIIKQSTVRGNQATATCSVSLDVSDAVSTTGLTGVPAPVAPIAPVAPLAPVAPVAPIAPIQSSVLPPVPVR